MRRWSFLITPYLYALLASAVFIFIENSHRGSQTIIGFFKIIVLSISVYLLQHVLLELLIIEKINPISILYFILALSIAVIWGLVEKIEM